MDAEESNAAITVELNARERSLIVSGLRNMWNMHVYAQIAVSTRLSDTDPAFRQAQEATDKRLRELRKLASRLGASIFDGGT